MRATTFITSVMTQRKTLHAIRKTLFLLALTTIAALTQASPRTRHNFNAQWQLRVGDVSPSQKGAWTDVTLPRAFNGEEAFKRDIVDHTDTVCWYRKTFRLKEVREKKVFVEFEGFRMLGDVTVNGHHVGMSENGVMAAGFDITPYVKKGKNEILVRTDNNWQYRSKEFNTRYQWNDRNFNANYGGIPKNTYLHTTGMVYQTLPLYSTLGTQGVYIYATDHDIQGHTAVINAESEVRNECSTDRTMTLRTEVIDIDGNIISTFSGSPTTLKAGATVVLKASQRVEGLHFWSWGYGYLYTVRTSLIDEQGSVADAVDTRTGFRKTAFHNGMTWINDRAMMVHGYAQRTSNEWPGTGLSVPAWLSDYSNALMVESGGNVVRWMHVTPWRQDVESCDRVGLLQAMPAGDAEADVTGPRWDARVALMRDAMIYNRNSPSIVFYEVGNKGVSEEHMQQMKALRDTYDPHGGRAIGSREMMDSPTAEYGGEMLYINKSGGKPMWAMEYCRDEGLRKYWDEWSYPYHKEGDGPLYKGNPATSYNHNMDEMAVEMVRRWYEYWLERPGTGSRVSGGGVKIVFSDTNTHHRGEANYRTSGVVDAMRLPKEAFYAHQVMWSGWVDDEVARTHIIGHWQYDAGTVKPVYVVSNADSVALWLNGTPLAVPRREYNYLFTLDSVAWQAGSLVAVGYKNGREVSRDEVHTVGQPERLRLTAITSPQGFKADGADMAMVEVEVVDAQGQRHPLANDMVRYSIDGPAEWVGGIALDPFAMRSSGGGDAVASPSGKKGEGDDMLASSDSKPVTTNFVGEMTLPVECGVNRVLVRSTNKAGDIRLTAQRLTPDGDALGAPATITLTTQAVQTDTLLPQMTLRPRLDRGETPLSPSFTDTFKAVQVDSVTAGSNAENALFAIDDNEKTEWRSNGEAHDSWITFHLDGPQAVDEVVLKLAGWRLKCYPLAVYAGDSLVWQGVTPPSLGYVHISIPSPVAAPTLTLKQLAPTTDNSKFGEIKELAAKYANTMEWAGSDKGKTDLRVIEADLLRKCR